MMSELRTERYLFSDVWERKGMEVVGMFIYDISLACTKLNMKFRPCAGRQQSYLHTVEFLILSI